MTNFLDYLIKQEIIDHKELKIITYGMNVIIFNFLNIVSIIAISSILGNIFFGILFLIVFILLGLRQVVTIVKLHSIVSFYSILFT